MKDFKSYSNEHVVTQKLGRTGIFCDISKKACDVAISKLEELE